MANEPITIKLSPEQILERQVQLENVKMQIEMSELNIKHFERMIEINLPILQTKVLLNKERAIIAQAKHNVIALEEQINSGEMS
jgi:hypothetical protein